MGQQTSKKPRRQQRKKQENGESVSDYHCYSCNISSEQNIVHNNIFKELLQANLLNQPHPKNPRSNANTILKNNPLNILKQSMALASIISDAYNKEISLNCLLSYRLEQNTGQLDYSIADQCFDSLQSDSCLEYNEKIYKKYNQYNDIDNNESNANRYKNYLMNDTISTRNESTIKGRVKVVILNKNNNSDKHNNINNTNTTDETSLQKNKISMKPSETKKKIKEEQKKTMNQKNTSEAVRKVSPKVKVIMQLNNHQTEQIKNLKHKQEICNKKDNQIKSSKIHIIKIKPQTKGGGREDISKEKITSNTKRKELTIKEKSKDKTMKSFNLKNNISNLNEKTAFSSAKKIKKHIYHPNNNIKPAKYSKSPEPLLKKNKLNNNNDKRIRVKNLNININSLNVINTHQEVGKNNDEYRSKSNDQVLKCQNMLPNFKLNLSQVLGRASNEDNCNGTEKEKYSINSQDSNPKDIRRIDTPQFHQHKKSLSSKKLCEFNPNLNTLTQVSQPLSGEKFSFSRMYSLKGQML